MTEYSDNVKKISLILYNEDLIGIAKGINNPNKDEYDREAEEISERLEQCSNSSEVEKMLHEVFEKWFSKEVVESINKPLLPLAQKLFNSNGRR